MTIVATEPFIDWLTFNAHPLKALNWQRHFLKNDLTQPCKAAYHHQMGYVYHPSRIRQYLTRSSADKTSTWVIDGEAWNIVRTEWDNETALKVLRILARGCINFTRIDLTMDVFDGGELAKAFYEAAQDGNFNNNKRQVRTMKTNGGWGGCTTYIGARSSAKMLRIYDKDAESHGAIPATRFEFECKHWAAVVIQERLKLDASLKMASQIFNGLLWDFIPGERLNQDFPTISPKTVYIEPPVHERSMEWKQWIEKQVLPGVTGTPGSEEWDKLMWLAKQVNTLVSERSE